MNEDENGIGMTPYMECFIWYFIINFLDLETFSNNLVYLYECLTIS